MSVTGVWKIRRVFLALLLILVAINRFIWTQNCLRGGLLVLLLLLLLPTLSQERKKIIRATTKVITKISPTTTTTTIITTMTTTTSNNSNNNNNNNEGYSPQQTTRLHFNIFMPKRIHRNRKQYNTSYDSWRQS